MEQIIKYTRMICEVCDKQVVKSETELLADIYPFNGWIKLEEINVPEDTISNKNPKTNKHVFCSRECLNQFLQE